MRNRYSRGLHAPVRTGAFSVKVEPAPVFGLTVAFVAMLVFSPVLSAQTAARPEATTAKQTQTSAHAPDLSGFWSPRTDGIKLNTWDPSDPYGEKPDQAPMTPWAAAKWKEARPPFGAKQTFEGINDPVQRYCDPPGITRIYMYPWQFTMIQAPKVVYILYEFTRVWRAIAMDREHPQDPDTTWMGDSIGRYEGDTLVVDTIGLNDKTWLDHTGHPHSDALHVVERFRRVDHDTLELAVTIDDPKAYTKSFTGKKMFQLSLSPMGEAVCAYSEMDSFQKTVIDPATKPPSK
jgi:hypothetical protein